MTDRIMPDDEAVDEGCECIELLGHVKWFDVAKGFGFVICESGAGDVLLHANVLRQFGVGSVAEGSQLRVMVRTTPRGRQAVKVLEIVPPECGTYDQPEELQEPVETAVDGPLQPARVKWFDRAKGYGFANAFGRSEDIFLHGDVLRRSGLADLVPGEAIAVRVTEGRRGLMASEIAPWDHSHTAPVA